MAFIPPSTVTYTFFPAYVDFSQFHFYPLGDYFIDTAGLPPLGPTENCYLGHNTAETLTQDNLTHSQYLYEDSATTTQVVASTEKPPGKHRKSRPKSETTALRIKQIICQYIFEGMQCPHAKCTFAHGIKEMKLNDQFREKKFKQKLCQSGESCIHFPCNFFHETESIRLVLNKDENNESLVPFAWALYRYSPMLKKVVVIQLISYNAGKTFASLCERGSITYEELLKSG